MIKQELLKKSPLRKLDNSIHGGVGAGRIGIIAFRRGIGKTACLVHIATDKLMAGKHVIHVSYAKNTDHIIRWYEDIFKEISAKRNLENAMMVHDEIIHNRVIMNFSQKGTVVKQVIASLTAMIVHGQMETDVVVIDGFDFTAATEQDVIEFRNFAADRKVELWFSDDYHREDMDGAILNEKGIPMNLVPYLELIDVIITLKAEKDALHLYLVKDHDKFVGADLPLRLDPKTLLIAPL